MKKIAFLILLGAMSAFAWAQTAQPTMIDFNKVSVPGVIITITDYDATTVQNALQWRMERKGGLKGTDFKGGFRLYSGQTFTNFGDTKYNIYTRVIPGNKKNPEVIVNLLVSLGENFISPTSNPELNQRMIDFLTNFVATSLKEFDINQKEAAHKKDLEKFEKEYKKLVSDRDKTKKTLESQEKAVAAKAEQIAKTKAALGSLKN